MKINTVLLFLIFPCINLGYSKDLRDGSIACNYVNPKSFNNDNRYPTILFEFDSSMLTKSASTLLDTIVAHLKANPQSIAILHGYCSSEGTAAHNMRLARDRAYSVKTYLVNAGINSSRVKLKAHGETSPVANNSTEKGRELNRRVEVEETQLNK